MKYKLLISCYLALALFAIVFFKSMAMQPITFTMATQNPDATMKKYADFWNDDTIRTALKSKVTYRSGEEVGTITIPKMDFYEMPVYYGSNTVNTNWQITTAGYLGKWDMFGENGRAVVGAHNYQLFTRLPLLEAGDRFLIETPQDIFVYEVTGTTIYHHLTDDWTEVAYTAAEPYSVSLMTCYPITQESDVSGDMYIVYSKMVRGTKYE